MCDTVNISQNAELGAKGNTFIAEQHNYSGLSPVDAAKMAFTMFREYYPQLRQEALEALYKMVEEKLSKISPENMVSPQPRVAVPTLQNASLTEEEEIREFYAELLAKSMNLVVKNSVHPGFIEIIKQLCPDEAKILRYLSTHKIIPTITLRFEDEEGNGTEIVKNFSNVGELAKCEEPFAFRVYFDNMIRLGLLEPSPQYTALTDKSVYEPLKKHPTFQDESFDIIMQATGTTKTRFIEGYMTLTHFGQKFCDVCVSQTGAPE